MIIKKSEFVISAVSAQGYPQLGYPEIVFAGRSNVGKSSLINCLLNRKNLARCSSSPGKTRTINIFNVNDMLYFSDLPGYGYASVSRTEKSKWGSFINEYLKTSPYIIDIVLILDIRHEPTNDDKIMYRYLKENRKNVTIVMNKCDKIAKGQYQKHISVIKKALESKDDNYFLFSTVAKYGKEELWEHFDKIIKDYYDMNNL